MDRKFEWTKPIERRPWNLYRNSNRNGIGLYKQYKLCSKYIDEFNRLNYWKLEYMCRIERDPKWHWRNDLYVE